MSKEQPLPHLRVSTTHVTDYLPTCPSLPTAIAELGAEPSGVLSRRAGLQQGAGINKRLKNTTFLFRPVLRTSPLASLCFDMEDRACVFVMRVRLDVL